MKYIAYTYIICFSFVLISCSTVHKKIVIRCNDEKTVCNLKLPKFESYKPLKDLDYARSYLWWYQDTVLLYITNGISYNLPNIKQCGDSIYSFRLEYGDIYKKINLQKGEKLYLPELPDTFELSGINNRNRYWKDIYINGISIGYDNVPLEKKELFENCLRSFRMKIKKKR
jgi:hypothetical protein